MDNIYGQKSILVPMSEEDLNKLQIWGSDPLVCRNYHKNLAEEGAFLKETICNPVRNIEAYTINTEDNVCIGKLTIELEDDNTACIDMLIGEKVYTGKGYGKDALKGAVRHCFEDLNLDAVKMVFKEDNVRAEYCCWSCGLREDKCYLPECQNNNTTRMIIHKKDYNGY